MEKEVKNRVGVFGIKWGDISDPVMLMIEKMLFNLEKEDKIKILSEAFLEYVGNMSTCAVNNQEGSIISRIILFLTALINIFGDDNKAHREYLMTNIYPELPSLGDREYRLFPTLLKLHLTVLDQISYGWFCYVSRLPEEDPEGFIFLREVYRKNSNTSDEIKKGILEIIRARFEVIRSNHIAQDLGKWIIDKNTPEEIAVVLIKARAKIAYPRFHERELYLIEHIFPFERSDSALEVAGRCLDQITLTDSLAKSLLDIIYPHDYRSDRIISQHSKASYQLIDSKSVELNIVFVAETFMSQDMYPGIIARVQEKRDEILANVENPPKIRIMAEGPNKFSFQED